MSVLRPFHDTPNVVVILALPHPRGSCAHTHWKSLANCSISRTERPVSRAIISVGIFSRRAFRLIQIPLNALAIAAHDAKVELGDDLALLGRKTVQPHRLRLVHWHSFHSDSGRLMRRNCPMTVSAVGGSEG